MTSTHPHGSTLRARDLRALSGAATRFLKERVVEDAATGTAGWHNNFALRRIGTTGSAVPLSYLRDQHALDSALDAAIVRGLVAAQRDSEEDRGGWCILSLSDRATVEGTAPTLAAVARSEGPGVAAAIQSGRDWLLGAQRADGGWGSTADDTSRTCLTASAALTLARLDSPPIGRLSRAANWLRSQQNSNGSWGEKPGSPPSVVHTALALRALTAIDGPEQLACTKGLEFLTREWPGISGSTVTETYDASMSSPKSDQAPSPPKYNRVTLSHDVDAEVVLTLLSVDPLGSRVPYWAVVRRWVEKGANGRWPNPDDKSTTVWTVVQRANAAHELSLLIGPEDAEVRWNRSGIAVTTRAHRTSLAALAIDSLGFRSPWLRLSVFALSGVVAVMTLYLVLSAGWDASAIVAGVGLPAVISIIVAVGTGRKSDE